MLQAVNSLELFRSRFPYFSFTCLSAWPGWIRRVWHMAFCRLNCHKSKCHWRIMPDFHFVNHRAENSVRKLPGRSLYVLPAEGEKGKSHASETLFLIKCIYPNRESTENGDAVGLKWVRKSCLACLVVVRALGHPGYLLQASTTQTLVNQGCRIVFEFVQADKIHLCTYQKNKTGNKRYQPFFNAVDQNIVFITFTSNKTL